MSTVGITPVHRGYPVEIDKMHYILAVHGFGESRHFILRCRPSRYGCIFGSYLRWSIATAIAQEVLVSHQEIVVGDERFFEVGFHLKVFVREILIGKVVFAYL